MYFQHSAAMWAEFPELVPGALRAEGVTAGADVSKNSVERPNVAVNVCDCSKTKFRHRPVKLAQLKEQIA